MRRVVVITAALLVTIAVIVGGICGSGRCGSNESSGANPDSSANTKTLSSPSKTNAPAVPPVLADADASDALSSRSKGSPHSPAPDIPFRLTRSPATRSSSTAPNAPTGKRTSKPVIVRPSERQSVRPSTDSTSKLPTRKPTDQPSTIFLSLEALDAMAIDGTVIDATAIDAFSSPSFTPNELSDGSTSHLVIDDPFYQLIPNPVTDKPSDRQTAKPLSDSPSKQPTRSPSNQPTRNPLMVIPKEQSPKLPASTQFPSLLTVTSPSSNPPSQSREPSHLPTLNPFPRHTSAPGDAPTSWPINGPNNLLFTDDPTFWPTQKPVSKSPSKQPTSTPVTDSSSNQPTRDRTTGSPTEQSSMPTTSPKRFPTLPPTALFDGMSGAIVTRDCLFQDYPYAIDIFWSCGEERFNNPLRLHTFKRHSYSHERIFADQLMTYRNQQLWFDEYDRNRCVSIDDNDGDLILRTSSSQCDEFILSSEDSTKFQIIQATSGRCITLGGSVSCSDDKSTGGRECGREDHRYLPLTIGACAHSLSFQFATKAGDCTNGENEFPDYFCF